MNFLYTILIVLITCLTTGCNNTCPQSPLLNELNLVVIKNNINTVKPLIKGGEVIYDSKKSKHTNELRQDNIVEWVETSYTFSESRVSVVYMLYDNIDNATKSYDFDISLRGLTAVGDLNNRFVVSCPRQERADGEGGFTKFDYFTSGFLIQKNNLLIQIGENSSIKKSANKDLVLKEVLKVIKQLSQY